jgi:hypothetical protein
MVMDRRERRRERDESDPRMRDIMRLSCEVYIEEPRK